jgi:hypothetical protein
MPVPKAAVNEDCLFESGKNEIGRARQIATMQSEATA